MNFKRDPRIIFKEEGEVGLLFNPDSGTVNILNETGKFIWALLDGEKTKADIVARLDEEFEVAPARSAAGDFDAFVNALGALGFLHGYVQIPPFPRSICFGITSRCNLQCKHCLNRNPPQKHRRAGIPAEEPDMTTEQLLGVIDEIGGGGVKNVSLFGGEPLCHPDFKRIVLQINKYPVSISLNTNATLIDDATAAWLKGHRVNGAVVSFDGSTADIMERTRGEGVFEKCLRGIGALRGADISVLLSVTITKINYQDIRAMVLAGKKIGGSSIRFNHVFFGGNAACFVKELYLSPDEEREAIEAVWRAHGEFGAFIYSDSSYLCQKKKLEKVKFYRPSHDTISIPPCGAAMSKCAIRPDGWITPCEIMWDVKCGNVKEKKLADIWRDSEVMMSLRKPLELHLDEIPQCKGCAYQYVCFIGHRCYPYHYPGGLQNRDLYCWKKNGTDYSDKGE